MHTIQLILWAQFNRKSEDKVKQILESEGGIKPAAKKLGVSHSTLRTRYPKLCEKYTRKTPVKIDEQMIEKILDCAVDPKISIKEASRILGVGCVSIIRYCKRRGVPWTPVKRPKTGEVHATYRGKPTLRSLILNGTIPELAEKKHLYAKKPLPRQTYRTLYQK